MRVVNENTQNAKAGEGNAFFVNHTFEAVASAAKIYLRHKSGSSKYLHSVLDLITVGQWRVTSYSGTTYTADGTELTPINRKSDSAIVSDTTFWHTPTIDVLGTPRLSFIFGTGTNPSQATTGEFGEAVESVFAPNVDVLIELENMGNSTQYLSGIFNFHEEG